MTQLGVPVSCACVFSCVWLFETPRTVAHQAPLSMGFPRQEYWSGVAISSSRIFPTQGLNLCLLHWQADSLPTREATFSLLYGRPQSLTYHREPLLSTGNVTSLHWGVLSRSIDPDYILNLKQMPNKQLNLTSKLDIIYAATWRNFLVHSHGFPLLTVIFKQLWLGHQR